MADPEISAQIQDWSTGGGLFLDYCNLLHSFAAYNKVSAADWFAGFFAVSSVMQMAVWMVIVCSCQSWPMTSRRVSECFYSPGAFLTSAWLHQYIEGID